MSHAIDVTRPSVARMYNWLLGGKDNYAADRHASRLLLQLAPSFGELVRSNKLFVRRAVRLLAEQHGVRQFLDHGAGLPAQDNVHQVVQRVDRDARVIYIDKDPMVLAHGRAVLEENDETAVVQADVTDTDRIFGHAEVQRLIDFRRPVAALFVSVLHCLPDQVDPIGMVRRVAQRLAPGSFVVVCQLSSEDAQVRSIITDFMRGSVGEWGRVRTRREVAACFDGMDVLDPGLVDVSSWRPEEGEAPPAPHVCHEYGGVGMIR
ncbi:SAM-dependent methyltransferase [Streptomyces albospinus]|uniref:SAM-dependent methyltransferase n=1 Tax=Streptomyces albospinus TaxID=285515 RepID=UPI00166FC796|nr:SAM-dependent methyltransferase [Streptomyces albospinus]